MPTPTGCTCARTAWNPEADFLTALDAEDERVRRGWAPFWHYRRLGLYGEQLERLLLRFPREQVHVLRYRELVDSPEETVAAVCEFLGVRRSPAAGASAENVKPFVPVTPRNQLLRMSIRAGAWAGSFVPPHLWRRGEAQLLRQLYAGGEARPPLSREYRAQATARFADDIALLERVVGRSFQDWLDDTGRGSFVARAARETRSAPPS